MAADMRRTMARHLSDLSPAARLLDDLGMGDYRPRWSDAAVLVGYLCGVVVLVCLVLMTGSPR